MQGGRMQWVANQLLSWAINVFAGLTNMIGALIMRCVAGLIGIIVWQRRRIKAGERGVEPSHLILFRACRHLEDSQISKSMIHGEPS
jgi:hypothetical protein